MHHFIFFRDLDAVLHLFRTKQYYELVWVDDNHALAVMNDAPSAKAAINYINNHAPPHSVHNIHAVQIRPFAQVSLNQVWSLTQLYSVDFSK